MTHAFGHARGDLRGTLIVCLLIAVLASAAPVLAVDVAAITQLDPRQMRFEPVQFSPPEPDRLVLPNGMVVYLLEDHELPLISLTASIQAGGWLESADKVGLASLVGIVMRTGGTTRMKPDEVDEELEQLAAQIAVGIGPEAGVATLDVLKKDLDRGLRILADILRRPSFDVSRVELEKLQVLESIRRRQDRPQSVAGREFLKMLYGESHPLARESSTQSITRISRDDLVAFHKRYVHPNGIILGVTGDFDKESMLSALKEVFGDWPRGDAPAIVFPALDEERSVDGKAGRRLVRLISKGTSQAHLRVGHLSVKEMDPDYPVLALLNDILGGGSFRSRLFQDIRTRLGLVYSVGSTLRPGTREPGVWVIRAETKIASTQDVIDRMVNNLERLSSQPVTDAELEEAKEAFVNSFVFSFTSPASIVSRLISLEYDGLPKDFLQQLRDRVVKLTKEDLLRAARAHLHPDRLRILAVGPPDTLLRMLSGFGEVKEIKLPPEE